MSESKPLVATDARGRVLRFKEMDPSDMLDLYEAAGSNSGNRSWMSMALIVVSLTDIDGIPVPMAIDKAGVKRNARTLGNDGLVAGQKLFYGDDTTDEAAEKTAAEAQEAAKN